MSVVRKVISKESPYRESREHVIDHHASKKAHKEFELFST